MAKLSQGTKLYWIKDDTTVVAVDALNISGISAQRDNIETTTLADNAKTYVAGMMSPGSAQFTIQFDPSNSAHKDLHAAYVAGTQIKWALGWSDGTAVPTALAGEFTLPTTRSFLSFDGYVSDVSFDFSQNSVVKANVSVQVSGFPDLSAKA